MEVVMERKIKRAILNNSSLETTSSTQKAKGHPYLSNDWKC